MKKGILFIILVVFIVNVLQTKEVQSEETFQTIPDDAIRLRILAHSDSEKDQKMKHAVRDEVNAYITELVQHIDDIAEGRRVIAANVQEIEDIVEKTLNRKRSAHSFSVEYKSNITFPTKMYDGYLYPAGEYEALLISIGAGKGANWWCVLFPPLCFLDFSNGTTVASSPENELVDGAVDSEVEAPPQVEEEKVEVKFFIFEWLGLS